MILAEASNLAIGNWVVVCAFILGVLLLILQIWKTLVPSPPEWKGHIESVRKEIQDGDAAVRRELGDKTDQLHGRVSKLRDEIRADLAKTAAAVNDGVREMASMHSQAMENIGKINGRLEANTQQLHATQQQLQRHVEKPHPDAR